LPSAVHTHPSPPLLSTVILQFSSNWNRLLADSNAVLKRSLHQNFNLTPKWWKVFDIKSKCSVLYPKYSICLLTLMVQFSTLGLLLGLCKTSMLSSFSAWNMLFLQWQTRISWCVTFQFLSKNNLP
jgi:hypothetical protein